MVGFLSSTVPDQSKTMPAKQVLPARKRKRPIDEDSTEATSAKSSTKHTHSQASNSVLQPTHLGQAYLTFGSKPLHITCKKCGMQYTKLSSEDGSLHAQYCKKAAGPIQWHPPANEMSPDTRAVILRRKTKNTLSSLQGCIAIIPYKEAGKAVQAKLQEIAARIDDVLSASPISEEELKASTFYIMLKSHTTSPSIRKQEVISCAITRPIRSAYRAVPASSTSAPFEEQVQDTLLRFGEDDSAIFCSPTPVPAVVGVDRIWTEQAWRGHGIAEALLNTIAAESVYGAPIVELQRRDTIAFSQPTEAGARLFKRWTGTPAFLVFT